MTGSIQRQRLERRIEIGDPRLLYGRVYLTRKLDVEEPLVGHIKPTDNPWPFLSDDGEFLLLNKEIIDAIEEVA